MLWRLIVIGACALGLAAGACRNTGAPQRPTAESPVSLVSPSPLPTCELKVDPENTSVAATSGEALAVITASGCGWTATSQSDWIQVTGPQGSEASGGLRLTLAANTNDVRTGTVVVRGSTDSAARTITVVQAAGTKAQQETPCI